MTGSANPADTSMTSKDVVCTDGFNRPKKVRTYLGGDRIVLLAPPAEVALLTPEAAHELAYNLHRHADELERQRRIVPFVRR
ncbi:hypothetical protein EV191_12043 [Tamaricihabitans halophyticus]|uniref:Uncharacterized protein n=1 Tax=Tamaricihabitans halophyticus TaxID=1262583 RepID=A0A4R2Q5W9_9PSEU|nr:hypothetical protein [Tamaricihabitans halophyticus]TCP43889.1 hypothetical protein EV191_12043 [Tamaricihabitans halophyticus]